jgi:hypothetical protein
MTAPLKNLVWIASYPKSGNTWVRFMACNLLYGRQASAAALNVQAPDIHETGAQATSMHAGLIKTHFTYSAALPFAERTAGAIYVVRDPVHVLESNFYYAQRSAASADNSQTAFDRYVDAFVQHAGDPRWRMAGMGSWTENVRSWIGGRHAFPVLRVRYEDLSANALAVCRTLAQFLKPTAGEEEIKATTYHSSFQQLREIEEADIREKRVGIFYKPYLQGAIDSGRRFMRRGTAGDDALRLTPEQQRRVRAAFAPDMRELGYECRGIE